MSDPWKCPQCNRVNAPWVPHCDCHLTGTASTFVPTAPVMSPTLATDTMIRGVVSWDSRSPTQSSTPIPSVQGYQLSAEDIRLKEATRLAIQSMEYLHKPEKTLETDAQKYEKMQAKT